MTKSFPPLLARAAFALAVLLALAPTAARAERLEKCPVESLDQAAIADAVKAAPSCAQAYEVMNVCRTNAGGDVALAAMVVETCEKVFMSTIEPGAARSYAAARDACARKFAHPGGPQSASFQATCEAGVAVVFAHRADLAAMRAKRAPAPYGNLAPAR
jgi:hypothetical protein